MPLPEYYIGVVDITLRVDNKNEMLEVHAPELGIDVRCTLGSLYAGQACSLIVPAFRQRDGDIGRVQYTCTRDLLGLLKAAQEEPDLLEKIEAITEAHKALNGN